MVDNLRKRHPNRHIAYGFLELARPRLDEAVAGLYDAGWRNILAVPVLLFAAGHIKRDLPNLLTALEQRHAGMKIHLGGPIGLTPALLESARRLAERAASGGMPAKAADTCLLVIGRGSSDPEANAEVVRLAGMVAERLGWGGAITGYVAVALPDMAYSIRLADRLPFRRVVVLPLVLFDGALYREIARALAGQHTQSYREWRLADPFCTDDAWLATLDAHIETAFRCR